MRFLSLFSGIGGFDLGFQRAGMECAGQAEIDRDACGVLARWWPDVQQLGDITRLRGHPAVDLVCGGFPCQDLSVAGKRAGLAGGRSKLWYEFHRILAELHPRWVVIENVPGLLSSNGGADMAVVLGGLAELGYGWAYRVLDAQYFGVAQRRRRVFIVGCLGDPAAAVQVLFEPESCGWDSPPSRKAREGVAGTLGGGSGERGWPQDTERMTFVPATSATITQGAHPGGHNGQDDHKDGRLIPVVAPMLGGGNYGQGNLDEGIPMMVGTLQTREGHKNSNGGTGSAWLIPIQDGRRVEKAQNGLGVGEVGDPAYTVDTTGAGSVAHTLSGTHRGVGNGWNTPYVRATRPHGANYGDLDDERWEEAEIHPSLTPYSPTQNAAVASTIAVRRLTPVECERLQGFPDGWTDAHADSTRYRMLGNAVCVPVVEWIGRRING